jgi:putative addiction module killer protein
LRDRAAFARITTRLARAELGNLGDHKGIGSGVMEMLIDFGPGYRVNYAFDGATVVLLLIGGDKRTQQRDIEAAI